VQLLTFLCLVAPGPGRAAELDVAAARADGAAAMDLFERGAYSEAAVHFERLLAAARELGDRRIEGVALTYLGQSLLLDRRHAPAARWLEEALPIVNSLKDRAGEIIVTAGLATAEFSLGRYADARRGFLQLLGLARAANDSASIAYAELGLGQVADALGDPVVARRHFETALAGARRVQDQRVEGRALAGLGLVDQTQGDLASAEDKLRRSLALARATRDAEGEINALGNLGTVLSWAGRQREATRTFEDSLRKARQRHDRQAISDAQIGIGLAAERAGNGAAAIRAYQQALDAARATGYLPGQVAALTDLGGALAELGRWSEARAPLFEAISLADRMREQDLEDLNRVRFFETQLTSYRLLRDVLTHSDNAGAALEMAERGRGQALRVQLAKRGDAATEQALRGPAPLSLSAIRRLAVEGKQTLIEYSIDHRRRELLIWVVQPDGVVSLRRSSLRESLPKIVLLARSALGADGLDRSARARGLVVVADTAPGVDELTSRLRELHRLLIEPVVDLLPRDPDQPVTLVPDAELYLVPFPALPDTAGRALIERHELSLVPSLDVLRLLGSRQTASSPRVARDVLVVGNPLMPAVALTQEAAPSILPSLPGTEREALAIAKLAGARPLLGAQATKAAFLRRAAGARLVHVASHGLLDDFGDGIPGAIALAPAPGDDGLLTAGQIAALRWRAELVVLSACDSGRGRISADGVVGLVRSVLIAGANSALVSLWQVPDDPTADLMTIFYRQFLRGERRARALRIAMLATRAKYPHVANWAAFVLVGTHE
jgi:tetratricopeptide (TPR) repeat protein